MELVNTSRRTGHGVLAYFSKLKKAGETFVEACALEGAELTIEKITQTIYGHDEVLVRDAETGMYGRLLVSPYEVKKGENYMLSFRPDPPDMSSCSYFSWNGNSKRGPLKSSAAHIARRAVESLKEEAALYEKRKASTAVISSGGGVYFDDGLYRRGFRIGPHQLQVQQDGSVRVEFVGALTAHQAVTAVTMVG